MKKTSKFIFFTIITILFYFLVLEFTFSLIFPYILLPQINKTIPKQINYRECKVRIFPYPHITIYNIIYKKDSEIKAIIKKLNMSINFCGIFSKKLLGLSLNGAKINFFKIKISDSNKEKGFNIPKIPIGFIGISNSSIIFKIKNNRIQLIDIGGLVIFNNKNIRLDLKGSSNILKRFKVNSIIYKKKKIFKANFKNIDISILSNFLPHIQNLPIKGISGFFNINLWGVIKTNKTNISFNLQSPYIYYCSKIEKINIIGNYQLDKSNNSQKVYIKKFRIDNPYIDLSANIKLLQHNIDVKIKTKKLDISNLRKLYLKTNINLKLMDNILEIVRSGWLENSVFSLANVKKDVKWSLIGNVNKLAINIPHVNLFLYDLWGKFKIQDNILMCKDISGRYRDSLLKNGYLLLGLNKYIYPFKIRTNIKYNLKDLVPLLKSLNISKDIIKNIEKFYIKFGTTSGTFILDKEKDNGYKWEVKLNDVTISGYVKELNIPFKIKCDSFFINTHILKLKNTYIFLKDTSINQANIIINFDKKNVYLEFKNSTLNAQEFNKLYHSFYQKKLPFNVTGNTFFQSFLINYSFHTNKLLTPYIFKGRIQNLKIIQFDIENFLNKKLKDIKKTSIKIYNGDFTIIPHKITFNSLDLSMFNSQINIKDLDINGSIKQPANISMAMSGVIDRKLQYIIKQNIPATKYISSGSNWNISSLLLDIVRPNFFNLNCRIKINGISTDIKITKFHNKVFKGKVCVFYNNKKSHIYFKKTGYNLYVSFKGSLNKYIGDKLLSNNKYLLGNLKGDCSINVNLNPIFFKDFKGILHINNFLIYEKPEIYANNLFIKSDNHAIKIINSELMVASNKLHLNGDIVLNKDMNKVHLFFKGNTLYIDPLLKYFSHNTNTTEKAKINIKGNINFDFHTAIYKNKKLKNIIGTVLLDKGFKKLYISNSNFCGIPLKLAYYPYKKNKDFELSLISKKFLIQKLITCMFPKKDKKIMSGLGKFNIKLKGSFLKIKDIKNTLQGTFYFSAKKGRIYKLTLLSKILSILNSTEIFFGQIPDLDKQGFGYKTAMTIGYIKKGIIFFKKSYINGNSMEIVFHGNINLNTNKVSLIIFFAPLKTIDRLIKKIPILNTITGGNLIVLPFQVVGNIDNPKLVPLSPKAVGSELLGIIKNTLKLPFKILQPLTSDLSK